MSQVSAHPSSPSAVKSTQPDCAMHRILGFCLHQQRKCCWGLQHHHQRRRVRHESTLQLQSDKRKSDGRFGRSPSDISCEDPMPLPTMAGSSMRSHATGDLRCRHRSRKWSVSSQARRRASISDCWRGKRGHAQYHLWRRFQL